MQPESLEVSVPQLKPNWVTLSSGVDQNQRIGWRRGNAQAVAKIASITWKLSEKLSSR